MERVIRNVIAVLSAIIFMVSCSSYVDEQVRDTEERGTEVSGLAEAKERLVAILNNPTIRSAYELKRNYNSSEITNGMAMDKDCHPLTRAHENEALYYTFSIDDKGGYAIIGNSPELPELIALAVGAEKISEESEADLATHGVGVLNLPSDLNIVGDSATNGAGEGSEFDPLIKIVCDSTKYEFIGPARPLTTQWGCEYPYNELLPTNEHGKHANAGCGCTAIAQFLAHKNYQPTYLKGTIHERQYNWDLMSRYTSRLLEDTVGEMRNVGKKYIAPLCSLLNASNNLSPTFNWDGASYISIDRIPIVLNKFGIYCNLENYSIDDIIAEFEKGGPIIITGGNHVWIIDAVMSETCYYTKIDKLTGSIISQYNVMRYLVHCNWGWDGKCNGYFYSGIFNPGKKPIIRGIGQEGPDPGNYQDHSNCLRTFINIRKY